MSVIPISGDDVIVRTRCRDCAAHHCLLANVKVTKAADLLSLILLTGAFFETADQQHEREHLDFVALLGRNRTHAVRGNALARERSALPSKLIHRTKSAVKTRSLRRELRKNIQLGVELYWGRPMAMA